MARSLAISILCFTVSVIQQFRSDAVKYGEVCSTSSSTGPWLCEDYLSCTPVRRLLRQGNDIPSDMYCDCEPSDHLLCVCCPPQNITTWEDHNPPTMVNVSALLAARASPSSASTNKSDSGVGSKAAAKCLEYAEFYISDREVKYTIFIEGPPPEPKEFLHMALLGYGDPPQYLCGGSLISERFVLSAAHCQTHQRFGPVRTILLGDSHLHDVGDPPRSYSVLRTITHKDYKSPSLYHDIMLIELSKSVRFSQHVMPICLQVDKSFPEKEGTVVADWYSSKSRHNLTSSNNFRELKLPFISNDKCNEHFKNSAGSEELKFGVVDDTQICAGTDAVPDSCQADFGGVLQVRLEGKMHIQVGIASFGFDTCGASRGIYTRVSAYVPWIESIVWSESPENSNATLQSPKLAETTPESPKNGTSSVEVQSSRNQTNLTMT